MDGKAAIEYNRQALMRILAAIVAMVGPAVAEDVPFAHGDSGKTLPRRLHRAVLRLLRPAESAARRLVIAMARGLVVTLPPLRSRKAVPARRNNPTILRNGVGTGIVLPSGGQGSEVPVRPAGARRPFVFQLTDPPRRWRGQQKRRVVAGSVPRIGVPGVGRRAVIPVCEQTAPDDPVDAARLRQRIEVLAAALDDLPGQARRFARWRARRDRSLALGLVRSQSPLRRGRPPGGRLSRYDPLAARPSNVREVDEVLVHTHALAVEAMERHDTS